jgi:polyisoprenoid-binding protein YceI
MKGTLLLAIIASVTPAPSALAASGGAAWRVTRGEVRVVCPMTVGGSFEAKTGAVAGTLEESGPRPSAFEGSLTVDLTTLDTGIGLRNDHLRREYLEVDKGEGFDEAVLSDIRLPEVDATTFQGRTGFTGTFMVHGTRRAVSGQAEVRREGASVRIEATFPVTLADYGIPKPQYLGIGVKSDVQVKASLVAMPVADSVGAGR